MDRSPEHGDVSPRKYTPSFISNPNPQPFNAFTADATTAVSLANANQSTGVNHAATSELAPTSTITSLAGSLSAYSGSEASSMNEDTAHTDDYDSHLVGLLNDLMGGLSSNLGADKKLRVFSQDEEFGEQFLRQRILPQKSSQNFANKLKHFFVLSSAGKPIYSLNGDDDVLLGYMGLITTIMASFSEGLGKDIQCVSSQNFKLVVVNKAPLALVAITKIPYELSVPDTSLLENQLNSIYNYILAVISQAVITKNFSRGLNYDLRRILSTQDFHTLDTLAMKLTYGFHLDNDDKYETDLPFYVSALLSNTIQCARISDTSRRKINDVLLAAKRLKINAKEEASLASNLMKLSVKEEPKYLASDLHFAFVTLGNKIVSQLSPKSHKLTNEDIVTLLFTVQLTANSLSQDSAADLWVPLCMPHFNSTGFLYCYVRKFCYNKCKLPLTIILMSGNKNSFFDMKRVAAYVISQLITSKTLSRRFESELQLSSSTKSILSELQVSSIKHFIYKRKDYNQIFMDEFAIPAEPRGVNHLNALSHLIYLYTILIRSNSKSHGADAANPRRLTYSRWQQKDELISGFFLTGKDYEFYCLCGGAVSSREIINDSLKVIQWCDRNKKRLFVRDGVEF